jgi:hypothetical protein
LTSLAELIPEEEILGCSPAVEVARRADVEPVPAMFPTGSIVIGV